MTRNRLERGLLILVLIDRRRSETGCLNLGSSIKRQIVERELRELNLEEERYSFPQCTRTLKQPT